MPNWKVSAAIFLALLLAGESRADDSLPPCWRGQPGTTFQNWAFAISNNPAAPDVLVNPNGTPQATLTQGPFATGWKASSLGRTGVWDLGQGSQVSLAVPNFGGSLVSWKYVQVQVTYLDAPGLFAAPATSWPGATLLSSQTISNQAFGPGVWRTQVTYWLMQPSPASETILIDGDATKGFVLDQILVDTRSPAPGSGDIGPFQPCWRGQPGSTYQNWLFGVSNSPAAIPAELVTNPFGTPQAVLAAGPFSSGYIEEDAFLGCRQGIWDLGQNGMLTLGIPNNSSATAGSYKYVQVQVTEYRDFLYNANATVSIPGATLINQNQTTIETTTFGGQWVVAQTIWRFGPPSPGSESVVITGGANGSLIDQVVIDTLSLDFPCPANIFAVADLGECSKSNVTWTLPAINGCTVTNVSSTPPSGSTFPVGSTLVTSVIQDSQGGSRTCQFQVNIADTQPPLVVCPANIIVPRDPLQCGAFVSFSSSAFDNCPGAASGCTPGSGSLFPLGLTTVTCLATDSVGNVSAPCNFTVRVVDLTGDLAANHPCWRGLAGSTFQQWAFSVSNNPASIPAELVTNSYGAPQGTLAAGPFSVGYIESDSFLGCRQGIWDLGQFGTLTIAVPNNPAASAGSYKYVQVQVTQYRDSLYNANATVSISGATLVSQSQTTVETTTFGGQWIIQRTVFRVGPPSPASESVVITGGANGSLIDQVVADTLVLDFPCPADITAAADPGQCSKSNVSWTLPAINGCTVTNVVSTPPSGSTFPVGTNPVIALIYDGEGGTKSCSFSVIITGGGADIAASIFPSANPAPLGEHLIYAITVTNGGPCPAADVVLSNYVAPGQIRLAITNLAGVNQGCPDPGPVAWWKGEGNANDSADSHNGIVIGGVSYLVGEVAQSFSFDGTSGAISVADAPGLRPASVTLEGWIRIQDVTGVHVIIAKRVGAGSLDSYSLFLDSGVLIGAISDNAGSGPFMTYSSIPSSSLFVTPDLVDLQDFAFKIKPASPADAVSQFIKTNLSPASASALASYSGGPNPLLASLLIHDLNSIIQNGSIYDATRFSGVALSAESQYILGRNPMGEDLVRLNRFLLRDAYPTDFSATVFPQLNDWFHVAYTFDGLTQVQALYVNGVLVNSGFVNKSIAYDAHPVLLGADDNAGSPGFFYQGRIDEMSIYDRALTGMEIQAIYQADGGGKCDAWPSSVSLGTMPGGASAQLALITAPIQCPTAAAATTASSSTSDGFPGNNTSSTTVPVLDTAAGQLVLTIQPVGNNNLVRLNWPLTCNLSVLQATPSVAPPVVWTNAIVPLQLSGSGHSTVIPASEPSLFFRVNVP